jgi:transposase
LILSHKIQLDPTVKQAQYFVRACGTARFTWNYALSEWNKQYAAGEKPKAIDIKRAFNAIKYEQFPWISEIHRDAHFYPSSKLCSHCGSTAEEMPLSIREWTCTECGAVHDRDINAAMNLKPTTEGFSGSYASGEHCGKNVQRKRNYTVGHSQVLT